MEKVKVWFDVGMPSEGIPGGSEGLLNWINEEQECASVRIFGKDVLVSGLFYDHLIIEGDEEPEQSSEE